MLGHKRKEPLQHCRWASLSLLTFAGLAVAAEGQAAPNTGATGSQAPVTANATAEQSTADLIESLRKQISEMKFQVKKSNKQCLHLLSKRNDRIANLSSQIAQQASQIADLQGKGTQIADQTDKDKQIAQLSLDVAQLRQDQVAKDKEMSELLQDRLEKASQISDLTLRISTMSADPGSGSCTSKDNQISELLQERLEKNSQIEDLTRTLEKQREECADKDTAMPSLEDQAYPKQLEAMRKNLTRVRRRMSRLEEEKAAKATELASCQASKSSQDSEIAELKAAKVAQASDITKLEASKLTQASEIKQLQSSNAEQASEIEGLRANKASQATLVLELQRSKSTQAAEIAEFQTSTAKLREETSGLREETKGLREEKDTLLKDAATRMQEQTSLRAQLADLTQSHQSHLKEDRLYKKQCEELWERYSDPSIQHFLTRKAVKVYSHPGIEGAANKTYHYVLPSLLSRQRQGQEFLNSSQAVVFSSLNAYIGSNGSVRPWLPMVSGFLTYGLAICPFLCTTWCLTRFVCRIKPCLIFLHLYFAMLTLLAAGFAIYTGMDPLSTFADLDGSIYLVAQVCFAVAFVLYGVFLCCACTCSRSGTGEFGMRFIQMAGFAPVLIAYFLLVWTPAMLDRRPRVARWFTRMVGSEGRSWLWLPYLVTSLLFFFLLRLEQLTWRARHHAELANQRRREAGEAPAAIIGIREDGELRGIEELSTLISAGQDASAKQK